MSGAKRILECEASVTALTYAPSLGFVSVGFCRWSIKLWDREATVEVLSLFRKRPRLRARRPATTKPWRTSGAPLHRVVLKGPIEKRHRT